MPTKPKYLQPPPTVIGKVARERWKYDNDPIYRAVRIKKSSRYFKRKYDSDDRFRDQALARNSARAKERRRTDPEYRDRMNARSAAWAKANPGRQRIHVKSYRKKKWLTDAEWRKAKVANENKRRRDIQIEAIQHYGGRCYCCGEKEHRFLALDHINGGGNKHRKEIKNKMRMSEWAKRNGWPKIFRIACHNCNIGQHRNGGICPHQEKKRRRK